MSVSTELFSYNSLLGFNVAFISERCLLETDTLTNVLPHRNAMPQAQAMTPHPVTVYRHMADLSLCYPLMWDITLEYTTTHFNVLGQTRSGNHTPIFHIHRRTLNFIMVVVRSSIENIPNPPILKPCTSGVQIHYTIARPQLLLTSVVKVKSCIQIYILFNNLVN